VGVRRTHDLTWFEEVDSNKKRRARRRRGSAIDPKRLRSAVVPKRAGRVRR
jgi:hypothetical protein